MNTSVVTRTGAEPYRIRLRDELAEQRIALRECKAAFDEIAESTDQEAIELRVLTRRAQVQALVAIDDIERALQRLDAGTYGYCDACGEPIGAARLDALPCTVHCFRCASVADERRA
jgi:RNA polymerase-binding protein DksA